MTKLLAEPQRKPGVSPSTPSATKPIYHKEPIPRRRKKTGARNRHQDSRRPQPPVIHQRMVLRLERCPVCQSRLNPCQQTRTRIVEDLPERIDPVVTEYTIHRDGCPPYRPGLGVLACADPCTLAGTARPAVERQERSPFGPALAAAPARVVYVLGSRGGSL